MNDRVEPTNATGVYSDLQRNCEEIAGIQSIGNNSTILGIMV